MHQPILMHADIHKRAEIGHVGHRAFQHHARLQIVHRLHALGELGGFKFRTRVAAGFFQLFDNVGHGRHAETLVGKIYRLHVTQRAAVAHQITQRLLRRRQNALHHRIGFRVNR